MSCTPGGAGLGCLAEGPPNLLERPGQMCEEPEAGHWSEASPEMARRTMRAMRVERHADIDTAPLVEVETVVPDPGAGEVLVRVNVCGVCHTDLHVAEGDLQGGRLPVTPGHQALTGVSPNTWRFPRRSPTGCPRGTKILPWRPCCAAA